MSGSQKHKVIVGLPMKSDKRISFALTKFLAAHDEQVEDVIHVTGTDGCINRNMIITHFLTRKGIQSDHLFFIDADTAPNQYAIDNLLELEKDIACGVVPIWKSDRMFWNVMPVDNSVYKGFVPAENIKKEDTPFKVRKTGPACMMIKRNVLENISFPYFRNDCEQIGTIQSFLMRQPYTAGDFYFCEQVLKAGFEIWAVPKVRCNHYNNINLLNFIKE